MQIFIAHVKFYTFSFENIFIKMALISKVHFVFVGTQKYGWFMTSLPSFSWFFYKLISLKRKENPYISFYTLPSPIFPLCLCFRFLPVSSCYLDFKYFNLMYLPNTKIINILSILKNWVCHFNKMTESLALHLKWFLKQMCQY